MFFVTLICTRLCSKGIDVLDVHVIWLQQFLSAPLTLLSWRIHSESCDENYRLLRHSVFYFYGNISSGFPQTSRWSQRSNDFSLYAVFVSKLFQFIKSSFRRIVDMQILLGASFHRILCAHKNVENQEIWITRRKTAGIIYIVLCRE